MSSKIILVEDSKEIYRMVLHSLAGSLSDITWVPSIFEAKKALKKDKFNLAILDIELPDGNGMDLCGQIQAQEPLISIFFLTSHDNLSEKVLAFTAGAEDYITKPFEPLELRVRVESKLKKIKILQKSVDKLSWQEIEILKNRQEVKIQDKGNSKFIDLTALEFKLLSLFAARVGEVIERDEILNQIWGENIYIYARSVDTHVSKLRKKLGPVSHIIESVHGVGYKFSPTRLLKSA